MVDVAQLVRVLDCGSEGRGFEPRLPPPILKKLQIKSEAFFIYPTFLYIPPARIYIIEENSLP